MSGVTIVNAAVEVDVPSLEENPAERKRVLNILAQRRYRRKKKEHLQHLERSKKLSEAVQLTSPLSEDGDLRNVEVTPTSSQDPRQDDDLILSGFEVNNDNNWTTHEMSPLNVSALTDDFTYEQPTIWDYNEISVYPFSHRGCSPPTPLSIDSQGSHAMTSISSASTPSTHTSNIPRDDVQLPMTELMLLRGMMTIVSQLKLDHVIWDLSAVSPFCIKSGASLENLEHLPMNLRPTVIQSNIPHHPSLDLLPWPTVRDKLIIVFSQPEEFRPPSARSPTALVEFVHDFEDSAEGARIWGDNPAEESSWEIGQAFFERWWWALSKDVIKCANGWRKLRGAKMLQMPASTT